MGIDKTQSAMEILKHFYNHSKREAGVTISELREKVLPREQGGKVWLRSKLGLSLVKDIVQIFLNLGYIAEDKPIVIKDRTFSSYRITKEGKNVVEELSKTKKLNELFFTILYKEIMKPV